MQDKTLAIGRKLPVAEEAIATESPPKAEEVC